MPSNAQLTDMIRPLLAGMGFDLVQLQLMGAQAGLTLQVMAERADRSAVTVENCAAISRALGAMLDEGDVIPGNYMLEVGSPGIDRPLTRREDFVRFAGCEVKIETLAPMNIAVAEGKPGRKNFKGRLEGVREEASGTLVEMVVEGFGLIALPLTAVAKARLVITDDLIKAGNRK
ncbi:MAG: ribosome maturation factor RimP [Alphaproteobacteria bacterium]|nr:ribosome maturation factor RimP [Alphaproteobacteria bacterium]